MHLIYNTCSWVKSMELAQNRFLRSLQENWKGMLLMAFSALTVAVGQLLWKQSGGRDVLLLLMGFALYGLGAVLMVLAFKNGKLSVVHPVLSVSYVLGAVFGYVFLGEILRPLQFVAIVTIIVGVALIGGGDHE